MLTEVTFRPHSLNYCSFTALIQDDRDEPEFSFGQFARLIERVGHVWKIEDFTIKPLMKHSFLVTGFSRYTSSRPLQSGRTVGTATDAGRIPLNATRIRTRAEPLARELLHRSGGSHQVALMIMVSTTAIVIPAATMTDA